jgi:hypothetical protein
MAAKLCLLLACGLSAGGAAVSRHFGGDIFRGEPGGGGGNFGGFVSRFVFFFLGRCFDLTKS